MAKDKVDIKKIIKDMQGDFGSSNEKQMAGLQLMKGIATSDEDIANEFMDKVDKAITKISKEVLDEGKGKKKESVLKEYSNWIYSYLHKEYPSVWKKVESIANEIGYDVSGAYSFAVEILQAVNAHSEAEAVAKILEKFSKQFESVSNKIELSPGQIILDESGNKYKIEEGDSLVSIKESSNFTGRVGDMLYGIDRKSNKELILEVLPHGYLLCKIYDGNNLEDKIKVDWTGGIDDWLLDKGIDVEWDSPVLKTPLSYFFEKNFDESSKKDYYK